MPNGQTTWEQLFCLFPMTPNDPIPWDAIEQSPLGSVLEAMSRTPQNPVFHGEGDVLAHTKLVCRELIILPKYLGLSVRNRQELFLAALLHDMGKTKTTRIEHGEWVSPRHSVVGGNMARTLLWQEFDLCGTPEKRNFRETVCALIRYHMVPERAVEGSMPEFHLRTIASIGELAPDFTWDMLSILAEADVRGRIAPDIEDLVESILLSNLLADELDCLNFPARFASPYTKRAYFSGRNVHPEQRLYHDSWGEVILLSGLPGTGKDTWIARKRLDFPMISLDGIRMELGVGHGEAEAKVIQLSQERAREYLRQKRPFVWNATCITVQQRQKLIRRFENYGAAVKVIFLETGWGELRRRNAQRVAKVPENAIDVMLSKLEPPMPWEAYDTEWLCV